MTGKKVDIKALTAKINVQEQKQAIEHASKSFVEKSATLNWAAEKMVAWVDKKLGINEPHDYVANKVGITKDEAVKLTEGMNKQQLDKNPPLFVQKAGLCGAATHPVQWLPSRRPPRTQPVTCAA